MYFPRLAYTSFRPTSNFMVALELYAVNVTAQNKMWFELELLNRFVYHIRMH
jgi:hypothetical protein